MSGEEEELRRRRPYKGVRRRRWGKWVSEIRVPGTRERLWLGSYATPEAAAVAHDTAVYFLRAGGGGSAGADAAPALNFPERAAAAYGAGAGAGAPPPPPLSPRSVQRVASDAGMATDAQLVAARESSPAAAAPMRAGAGAGRTAIAIPRASGARDASYACQYIAGSTSTTTSTGREQLVCGEISVDDMEIMM